MKKIVFVNLMEIDYLKIQNNLKINMSCVSDFLENMLFKEVFLVNDNSFAKTSKNTYILFSDYEDKEMATIYEKIAKVVDREFIVVKLLENNQDWQLSILLEEVKNEDEIMRKYYYLESLLKKVNMLDISKITENNKKAIMNAYEIYKKDDYNLLEIDEAISKLDKVLKN